MRVGASASGCSPASIAAGDEPGALAVRIEHHPAVGQERDERELRDPVPIDLFGSDAAELRADSHNGSRGYGPRSDP